MAEDLRSATHEWITLKQQIQDAKNDMKVLTKRERELREIIKSFMVEHEVDDIKVGDRKVAVKEFKRLGSLTREVIKEGLLKFFENDTTRAEACYKTILDSIQKKSTHAVTVRAAKPDKV